MNHGNYIKQPNKGKTTMARVWAGWAHGQNWYREKLYLKEGYKTFKLDLDLIKNVTTGQKIVIEPKPGSLFSDSGHQINEKVDA